MPNGPLFLYKSRLKSGELRADPVQKLAMIALDRLYRDLTHSKGFAFWQKKPVPKGVYLYGGVGRGKSMLMDLFMSALPDGVPARRVHFHEFMIEVHHYLHLAGMDGRGVSDALPRFARELAADLRVLCFDEFHVVDIADAMILGRLFTALFKHGLVVVATSNWAPDDLYQGGLQRDLFLPFIALLKHHVEPLHLDSPTDYRTQFLTEEGVYFAPLSKSAQEHANRLFTELTGGTPPTQDQFEVKGRQIRVHAVASGIARFSFAQLCEQPHGAEDYLAIAARYKTVFVEAIPKMGYDRRNEAKRFMILIDALYEAGTRVIFTADATPDKLYVGDDHAYEFERTVSRLQEMQSAEYLEA